MHKKEFNGVLAIRITLLGLIANLFLAILKGFIGFFSNSSALIADAGHSFSDLLSDGITIWAVKMSNIPKDKNHPYGHGKFETIGTFFVSILLILTGVGVAWHLFNKFNLYTLWRYFLRNYYKLLFLNLLPK